MVYFLCLWQHENNTRLCKELRLSLVTKLQHRGHRWQRDQGDGLESTGGDFRASETNQTNRAKMKVVVYSGYCSIQFFWIVNPIQIHHKYMIDIPNPNPIIKMDWQSNPNPITIQLVLKKRYRTANNEWSNFMVKPWNSQETFLIKFQP